MSEYIDREKAIAKIKAAYCCGCENYNGVRCRACQIKDAMDVMEDEPAVPAIDAKSMKKYLTELTRIGYMLEENSGVQTDGKT